MVKNIWLWLERGWLIVVFYINSCGSQEKDHHMHQDASCLVASVHGQGLYQSDLQSITPLAAGIHAKDYLLDYYIDDWAFKKLLMMQSKSPPLDSHMACIDHQVNQYKADLLAYHFLEEHTNQVLSKEILSQEIEAYYQSHKQDFLLNHDLVKGLFVAIPIRRRAYVKHVKALMLSDKPEDFEALKQYCTKYAQVFLLEPNKWVAWPKVLTKIGYHSQNRLRVLSVPNFIYQPGRNVIYLFKIHDHQASHKVAPLEVVQERIKAIILHKRRLLLGKKIKRKLLQDAKNNKIYVRYVS